MTPTGNYVGQNAPDPVLVAPVAAVERAGLLEARVATLETALLRYGHHGEDCESHVGFYAPGIPAPCTCGLDAALGGGAR